jgi:DMSO/TMAO reductase YedYZ molybdopterin-dependent catalytic subunit
VDTPPEITPASPPPVAVGRRIFLGLLGAGAGALLVGGRLVQEPKAYKNVSTMPVNLNGADTTQPRNLVFRGLERFRYYSVAPVPTYKKATWRLRVGGLVDRPLVITYTDLYTLPSVYVRADFRCVTGWVVHDNLWRGIQLRSLFQLAGAQPAARFVTFTSFDGIYRESFTLDQAQSEHAIVAFELNKRPLPTEQGAPARIVNPDMFGYKNLKWLGGISLTAKRENGYWEQKGWCNPLIGSDFDDCA